MRHSGIPGAAREYELQDQFTEVDGGQLVVAPVPPLVVF